MTHPTRRHALAVFAAAAATPVLAQSALEGASFGISSESYDDQTKAVQTALDAAHRQGRTLALPAGMIFVSGLEFPAKTRVTGTPGATMLAPHGSNKSVGKAWLANDLELDGIGFFGPPSDLSTGDGDLLEIEGSYSVRIVNCQFISGTANGLSILNSTVTIEDCDFEDLLEAAIFSQDSKGLMIRGNRIKTCGNGGILVWQSEKAFDGSIISGNRIDTIGWTGGGNGQNGNGINVFRAGGVVIADNVISGCAFSAVRLNASTDCTVTGNLCRDSGEVAIFSEFEFSGSVIANNIVDGAAQGISITNLDGGGQLATCSGNIVRNITPNSAVNPDTSPVGIYAEAETVISNNSISNVPGFGIVAGFGPYLRNVTITGNVITSINTGIGVSVVDDPQAGPVSITNNQITNAADAAIVGMRWDDVAEPDLATTAGNYPHVLVAGNQVSRL